MNTQMTAMLWGGHALNRDKTARFFMPATSRQEPGT